MKLTFLGSAAAEGMPALFCNCKYCMEAKKRGGKNVRTRSQSMINDDLLIDFSADAYLHSFNSKVDFSNVKYVIFTHSHSDHCYPDGLKYSGERLTVVGNEGIRKKIGDTSHINFILNEEFVPIQLGNYTVTPFPAYHMQGSDEKPKIYMISDGEKNLLYAHDTGFIFDEIIDYIKGKGIHLDFCSLDCTSAFFKEEGKGAHMCFDQCSITKQRLIDSGIADDVTVFYVNHFSHNAYPLHEEMCEEGKKRGFGVSYDGHSVII